MQTQPSRQIFESRERADYQIQLNCPRLKVRSYYIHHPNLTPSHQNHWVLKPQNDYIHHPNLTPSHPSLHMQQLALTYQGKETAQRNFDFSVIFSSENLVGSEKVLTHTTHTTHTGT